MLAAAFAPVVKALESHAIPGAALGIVTASGSRWVQASGLAAIEPTIETLSAEHWFDLASLTKVIATTQIILTFADGGHLDLDRPIAEVIPDLRQYAIETAPERKLTFRDCLAHRTHFPAVEPIYTYGDDPARLRAFVLQREWAQGPPVYSDINFILLGIAIERITGASMADWPLDAELGYGKPLGPAVSTEYCRWRGRVMKGRVHDENCDALGGATGHAGLFGTVNGVLNFAERVLTARGVSPFMMTAIRTRVHANRTCGWEIAHEGWSGGGACSPTTIGHTGFTGTGLWVDFDRGLAWTLLTNRVHPSRHSESGIGALRVAVGNAVIQEMTAARGKNC